MLESEPESPVEKNLPQPKIGSKPSDLGSYPGKLMAALAYRDDKILARNLLSHPFFCLTPAEPFFRPDRSSIAPSCRVAVKDGRAFRGHPKGLSLTAASTMARWLYRSGRRSCVAAEHASSPRRSSRLPGSRSRSLYRSPGTPIGKSIDYLDFATIKLPAPAYRLRRQDGVFLVTVIGDPESRRLGLPMASNREAMIGGDYFVGPR